MLISASACSLLFSSGDSTVNERDLDAAIAFPDATVLADIDAGTPRIAVDPPFVSCGTPLLGFAKRTQIFVDYLENPPQIGYPLLVPIPRDVLASIQLQDDAADLRFT